MSQTKKKKWKQDEVITKKFILYITSGEFKLEYCFSNKFINDYFLSFISITESENKEQAETKVLNVANKIYENGLNELFCYAKEPYKLTLNNKSEWFTKGLRVVNGYKGYYCIVIINGVKELEGWLDNVDGYKSAYNKIRIYTNEHYGEDADIIVFIYSQHRKNKRPQEDEAGNLILPIKEAVKRGSGVSMSGVLKGIKELGIGKFDNIWGILAVFDTLLNIGSEEDSGEFNMSFKELNELYFKLYNKSICPYWYIISEGSKIIEMDTIKRDNIMDVLELSEEEINMIGKFPLENSSQDNIMIYELLGIYEEETRLSEVEISIIEGFLQY